MSIYEGPTDVPDKKGILSAIQARDIKHLVHFTRLENVDAILRQGLKPRIDPRKGKSNELPAVDHDRFDRRLHHVSLSVMVPNKRLFYVKRQNLGGDWSVILFDPKVLMNTPALFFPHNAASQQYRDIDLNDPYWNSVRAFHAMFEQSVDAVDDGSECLNIPYPQAEIQILGPIHTVWILGATISSRASENACEHINYLKYSFPHLYFAKCKKMFSSGSQ